MNFKNISAPILTILVVSGGVFARTDTGVPKQPPVIVRTPTPAPAPRLSEALSKNIENSSKPDEISRERREQAYAKMLEGQRHVWSMGRQRGQGSANTARLAKQAFQKAVELNPLLAEGYTALAELAIKTPPSDINEAVSLATLATKIDKNSFGAHKILSRLYTIKSKLNEDSLDDANTQKAIFAWREVARLDPRNAEAWAFLSEYYRRTNKLNERISALQNWQSSAAPLEPYFYRTVLGNQENLSPENASFKLGEAFFEAGRIQESVDVLNQTVADDPENAAAVKLLGRALEKSDGRASAATVQTLQQAIYSNPENIALVMLLARVQARAGNTADTANFINETIAKLAEKDKNSAANLQVSLGDMYADANRMEDAAAAYQKSLAIAGIDENNLATDNEREFAMAVYDKIIRSYKNANRFAEAKNTIDKSKLVLGDEDSFSDRQLVALYRENGKKQEALQALKIARLRFPDDYGFLRQEATVLTELGRVDEGVGIVKSLIGKKKTNPPLLMFDDFSNYLFISMLYGDAKRGRESIEAANQAYQIATSDEGKQIARLSLATAQQNAGDFKSAETTLRGILAESPNNPNAQNNLGYLLAERNERLEEAQKLIQQALETEPENPSYLDSLGWVFFKQGRLDLAEENLKKAMKYDASSAAINEHLGDVYQKQGKAELARSFWQKALNLASDVEQINGLKLKLGVKKPAK